jgi:hypothetical protein
MIFCAGQPSDYWRRRRFSSCWGPVTGCQGLCTPVTDACCHHTQDRVQHLPGGEKILPVSTTGVPDITKEPQAKPEPDQGNGIRYYDRREDPCLHTASWRLEGAFHRTAHKDHKHKRLLSSILSRRPRLSGSQSCGVPGSGEGGRAVLQRIITLSLGRTPVTTTDLEFPAPEIRAWAAAVEGSSR